MNKERLEKFINETLNAPNFSNGYDRDSWEKDKQELIRDLEVLETLKKHIYSSDESISIILDDLRCCEDFEKVKEWLNDKQRSDRKNNFWL